MSHQLWQEHHSHASQHHAIKSEHHFAMSEHEADPKMKALHKGLAAHHESEMDYHTQRCQEHTKAMKAEAAADLEKRELPALPKGFTVAAEPNPNPAHKLVPRSGQPLTVPVAAEPNVPLQFKKLFTLEDEEPGALQ